MFLTDRVISLSIVYYAQFLCATQQSPIQSQLSKACSDAERSAALFFSPVSSASVGSFCTAFRCCSWYTLDGVQWSHLYGWIFLWIDHMFFCENFNVFGVRTIYPSSVLTRRRDDSKIPQSCHTQGGSMSVKSCGELGLECLGGWNVGGSFFVGERRVSNDLVHGLYEVFCWCWKYCPSQSGCDCKVSSAEWVCDVRFTWYSLQYLRELLAIVPCPMWSDEIVEWLMFARSIDCVCRWVVVT